MKNTNYLINGVLAVAVIVLFILHFTGKKGDPSEMNVAEGDSCTVLLPIAYVNTDSLLLNYNFAKDLNEALMRKVENSRASINQKGQQLSAEMVEFENKVNTNAFLSRERAVSEQQRLEKKQRDLQELMGRNQSELEMERLKVNQQLSDTVMTALKVYNASKKYQFIFSNAGNDNILFANNTYDITKEVLNFLNARYKPEKK